MNGALVTAQEDGRGEKGRHSQLPRLWHSPPTPPTQGDEQLLPAVFHTAIHLVFVRQVLLLSWL